MEDIGDRLKKVRLSLNMDKQSFADKLGVSSTNTIYRWEKNLAYPSGDKLRLIYELFGININWLIAGKGEMHIGEAGAGALEGRNSKVSYIDQAVQLVDEAIEETEVSINERQKLALVEIIREELRKQAKSTIKDMLAALKGGKSND